MEQMKSLIETVQAFMDYHFNDTIHVEIGVDSASYSDTNDIIIGVKEFLYRESPIYMAHEDYYLKNGFDYKRFGIGYETFIILHELGHILDNPTVYKEVRHLERVEKLRQYHTDPYKFLLDYVRLPLEHNANLLAFSFLKKNVIACQDLDKRLREIKLDILKGLD